MASVISHNASTELLSCGAVLWLFAAVSCIKW